IEAVEGGAIEEDESRGPMRVRQELRIQFVVRVPVGQERLFRSGIVSVFQLTQDPKEPVRVVSNLSVRVDKLGVPIIQDGRFEAPLSLESEEDGTSTKERLVVRIERCWELRQDILEELPLPACPFDEWLCHCQSFPSYQSKLWCW